MSKQMPYPAEKQSISRKKTGASITVEAALAFPIFFFACMALCYLFIFIKTQYVIQREMYTAARDLSAYGSLVEPVAELRNSVLREAEDSLYGKDTKRAVAARAVEAVSALLPETNGFSIKNFVSNTADSLLIEAFLSSRFPDEVFKYIDGGSSGLTCDGSILFDIDRCLVMKCSYKFRVPLVLFPDITIPVEHSIRYRYFTGTKVVSLLEEVKPDEEEPKEEQEEEEKVLITDTGYCYHYIHSCPALNVRPKKVYFSNVSGLRNDGGAKYYPCEFCVKGKSEQDECYITPDGDRYHYDGKCQGLKRTILTVGISEVGKRRECKRCKSKKGTEDL